MLCVDVWVGVDSDDTDSQDSYDEIPDSIVKKGLSIHYAIVYGVTLLCFWICLLILTSMR